MEYKKNQKKFSLAFKKKVGEAAVVKKRKLEAEKHANAWNAKNANGQNQAVKLGIYKAMIARELFSDIQEEKCDSPDFKSCVQRKGNVNSAFDIFNE